MSLSLKILRNLRAMAIGLCFAGAAGLQVNANETATTVSGKHELSQQAPAVQQKRSYRRVYKTQNKFAMRSIRPGRASVKQEPNSVAANEPAPAKKTRLELLRAWLNRVAEAPKTGKRKKFAFAKAIKEPAKQAMCAEPVISGRSKYDSLIARYAEANDVPIKLAHAVVRAESSYRANARGADGEIGLMQLKLSTARGMGFKGSAKQLYDPATNLKYGMRYLGRAHLLARGSTCGTILKYNAGHGAKSMNPISAKYCKRVERMI